MENPQKILCVKIGALGDIVVASVSFIAIKETYKNSRLYLLTDGKFKEVVEGCPLFEKIFFLKSNFFKDIITILKIRKENIDITIDGQGNLSSNFLTFLSGAKERIGFYSKRLGKMFLTKKVQRANPLNPVDGQWPVLEKAGIKNFSRNIKVWISEEKRKSFRFFMEKFCPGTDKKWIVMHPSSSERWWTKRWPQDYFAKLSDILMEKGYHVIFIASKDGCGYIHGIIKKMKKKPVNLCGKTDFTQMALVLEKSSLLITTDSGPMHIGAALKIKVLAIFGPTDPKRHCPVGVECIYKKVPCGPCYKKSCDDLRCMKEITVEEVLSKSLLLLEKPLGV